jgi:hypothetical protein
VGLHAGIGYLLPAPVMQSTRDDRSAELINAGAATAQGAGAGVLLAAGAAVICESRQDARCGIADMSFRQTAARISAEEPRARPRRGRRCGPA